jgi:formamidopyrimidine-DNA glycosylase
MLELIYIGGAAHFKRIVLKPLSNLRRCRYSRSMPELPEIVSRAREMNRSLVGKRIARIDVLEPKCLNVSAESFKAALAGARIKHVTHRGKWIIMETTKGWLLLNLGMGGEVLAVTRGRLPEKRRLVFEFSDRTALAVNFWWFGYAHYVGPGQLDRHDMTRVLGPNATELAAEELRKKLAGRRGGLKAYLLDQSEIAGIGNAYIHDILFLAGLHPQRTLDSLSDEDIGKLATAIRDGLEPSIRKGGAFYELNLHGRPGGFVKDDILVGYREGEPCPRCRAPIKRIKTGSTSSFICPKCQPLKQPPKAMRAHARIGAAPRKRHS